MELREVTAVLLPRKITKVSMDSDVYEPKVGIKVGMTINTNELYILAHVHVTLTLIEVYCDPKNQTLMCHS